MGRTWLGAGTRLAAGRFEVLRAIGEGGMGLVYEAHDATRGERVARKTLSRLEASGVYRLKNEFRALADVTHENLVTLHELFNEAEQWFFSMELVSGEPFDRWVRPEVALDEERLRAALPQLVAGVCAIHAAGKLHRDLKPSNVLVTHAGLVKVLDFGLAADPELGGVGQTVAADSMSGTPAYMAPEQAAGREATPASDAYALGVMLFEALTGRLPFEGRGGETRRALEAIALAAGPLPLDVAAELAGSEGHRALDALRALKLTRAGAGRNVECFPDRIRERLVASLEPAVARGHHAALARALSARHASDPEMLAIHVEGAGEPERAAECFVRAAEAANAALAFDHAATLYARALALGDFEPARRLELEVSRGNVLAESGRFPEAGEAYLSAAAHAGGERDVELRLLAARHLAWAGQVDRGRELLESLVRETGLPRPSRLLPWMLARLLWQRFLLRRRGLDYTARDEAEIDPAVIRRLGMLLSLYSAFQTLDVVCHA